MRQYDDDPPMNMTVYLTRPEWHAIAHALGIQAGQAPADSFIHRLKDEWMREEGPMFTGEGRDDG